MNSPLGNYNFGKYRNYAIHSRTIFFNFSLLDATIFQGRLSLKRIHIQSQNLFLYFYFSYIHGNWGVWTAREINNAFLTYLSIFFYDLLQLECWLYLSVSKRATIFKGRLSFSTLVFLERLCFKVDYVSRATMYRVITVDISTYFGVSLIIFELHTF